MMAVDEFMESYIKLCNAYAQYVSARLSEAAKIHTEPVDCQPHDLTDEVRLVNTMAVTLGRLGFSSKGQQFDIIDGA